jgi:hypothetical protein
VITDGEFKGLTRSRKTILSINCLHSVIFCREKTRTWEYFGAQARKMKRFPSESQGSRARLHKNGRKLGPSKANPQLDEVARINSPVLDWWGQSWQAQTNAEEAHETLNHGEMPLGMVSCRPQILRFLPQDPGFKTKRPNDGDASRSETGQGVRTR